MAEDTAVKKAKEALAASNAAGVELKVLEGQLVVLSGEELALTETFRGKAMDSILYAGGDAPGQKAADDAATLANNNLKAKKLELKTVSDKIVTAKALVKSTETEKATTILAETNMKKAHESAGATAIKAITL